MHTIFNQGGFTKVVLLEERYDEVDTLHNFTDEVGIPE